jgi:hypothetical protein
MDTKANFDDSDIIDSLQYIVNGLRSANYSNSQNELIDDPAFLRLERLANAGRDTNGDLSDAGADFIDDSPLSDEPFHIEADIYDSGDYANLLVIPANGSYIVVGNNDHVATMVKTCDNPACWEQQEGSLDDEVVEKLGQEISNYIGSL